ncbi:MAG: hypothetical protein JEY91_02775 [Spirochaetaceae bacterium]|nr:hypothetical protein [Spirochaetaceae bacterium]
MEKMLNNRLYIIPGIFLLLAGLFFYLHYSQRIHFSQAIGNIELTGQSTKGTMVKSSQIKKLDIYVNGISFRFSPKNRLEVKTSDDILHKSELLNYSSTDDSFILYFENNINLVFKTDFADNKISIGAVLPETVPPIKDLTLPFIEDRGFTLGYTEEDNTPVITNGETKFFIAMTNEYSLSSDNKKITIEVTENTPITFMIQETLVGKGRTPEKWYEQYNGNLSTEYEAAVSNYVNNAFFGWNSRFNSKTGMWEDGSGGQTFNETTAISYLSESLLRGSYRTSASLIRTASVNLEHKLTALTAPYLGNIVEEGKELIKSQYTKNQKVRVLIDNNSRELYQIKDLINFMLSNNLETHIEKVMEFALSTESKDSVGDSINRLKIINEGYSLISSEEIDSVIIKIIENSILPSVNWLDEGLFLEEKNRINAQDSLSAGKEILLSGNILGNNFYSSVGKQMIISILSRSKESAFIPEKMITKDNRIESESGILHPEDIYYEITENPYYVKQKDLRDSLGSGSWILTSAQDFDIQKGARETTISVNFPKGSIHHFAIKGIKPFVRIYMHDMKWNSDPNFQRYSDGWVYDKSNETLYVKLKHRVDNESIRILYYNPDLIIAPAAESEETADNS